MRRIGRRDAAALLLGAVASFIALAPAMPASADGREFPTAVPEAVGVDSRGLVRLSSWIREERLDVRALLIVQDGRLIFERYSQGVTRDHNHAVYSVTKSITSLLIGMLIDDGKIAGPDAKIANLLSALPQADRLQSALADKQDVRVGHILSMSSGLRYTHNPESHPIYAASDRLLMALTPTYFVLPGVRFQYSDGDATIAGALVPAATGMNLAFFANQRLFQPLAMRNVDWPGIDAAGLLPGGWALRLRAIDMAKIGQLMLDSGVWNGQRLVSKNWIDLATTPKVSPYYGYFWWVGGLGIGDYWARGYKGQRIAVLPRHNAVVVVTSVLPRGQEWSLMAHMFREFIVPALGPISAVTPSQELQRALSTELDLAQQAKGDPRNTIEGQDTPRR